MKEQLFPTLLLVGVSILAGVGGQTAIKLGVSDLGAEALASPLAVIALVLRSPLVFLGLFFYAVGALAWIVVLSRLDLSYAYPFLALNFVLVAVVSRVALSESVPALRWIGIGCICVGILIVARSAPAG